MISHTQIMGLIWSFSGNKPWKFRIPNQTTKDSMEGFPRDFVERGKKPSVTIKFTTCNSLAQHEKQTQSSLHQALNSCELFIKGILMNDFEQTSPIIKGTNTYPSLPNTSLDHVLGMFLRSKYLLTRCWEA